MVWRGWLACVETELRGVCAVLPVLRAQPASSAREDNAARPAPPETPAMRASRASPDPSDHPASVEIRAVRVLVDWLDHPASRDHPDRLATEDHRVSWVCLCSRELARRAVELLDRSAGNFYSCLRGQQLC